MQKEREEIRTEPGEQCTRPYECWYYAYCHGESLAGAEGAEDLIGLMEKEREAGSDQQAQERD